jgi:hypothetical protein
MTRPSRNLLRVWIVACTVGELLGFGVAGTLAALVFRAIPDPNRPGLAVLLVLGAVTAGLAEGALLGACQWWALVRLYPRLPARSWVAATAFAAGLGWLIGSLPSTLISLSGAPTSSNSEPSTLLLLLGSCVGGAVLGAIFGAIQRHVLRAHAEGTWRWILSNAAGWAVALPLSYLAGSSEFAARSAGFALATAVIAGTFMGALVALATAVALRTMPPAHSP